MEKRRKNGKNGGRGAQIYSVFSGVRDGVSVVCDLLEHAGKDVLY